MKFYAWFTVSQFGVFSGNPFRLCARGYYSSGKDKTESFIIIRECLVTVKFAWDVL